MRSPERIHSEVARIRGLLNAAHRDRDKAKKRLVDRENDLAKASPESATASRRRAVSAAETALKKEQARVDELHKQEAVLVKEWTDAVNARVKAVSTNLANLCSEIEQVAGQVNEFSAGWRPTAG